MEIAYMDRKTRQRRVEKVYGHMALSLLYGDGLWRRAFSKVVLPLVSRFPLFSILYGYLQKRARSAKKIAPFIQAYEIDAAEFAESRFGSFNEFFIRKLKPESRPLAADPNVLTMPADGRYLVYPQFHQFLVKGKQFSLTAFLGSSVGAQRYCEGSMAIVRLCPTDYHRFHFPCDGVAGRAKLINGSLFSVNPMALKRRISILSENKRVATEIETERFGTILYTEVGATSVGSIRQTYRPGPVKKGDEKGYFEFGGSCLVLFFEKGRIVFDEDLVAHTERGLETRANFGESLGKGV